jgi:hypothetical protein
MIRILVALVIAVFISLLAVPLLGPLAFAAGLGVLIFLRSIGFY